VSRRDGSGGRDAAPERKFVSLVEMVGDSLWEQHAGWWQAGFTEGADPEYEEQVLPLVEHHLEGARRVLDVGCGEGQVSRQVARTGARAMGIDPASSQIHAAHRRGGGAAFVRARAEQLPCANAAFDGVVLCMALEHVDPFESAIHEIARVLMPGGRFLLVLVHPLLQVPGSGWVDDVGLDEQYWRVGAYLREDVVIDEVAPGIHLEFVHRPLSRYVHVMGRAGLLVEDMVEPSPPPRVLTETGGFTDAASIPRLMLLCARRIPEQPSRP
jgi:SAM-dependent methyltransferase